MTSTDKAAPTLTTLPEELCLNIVDRLDMASLFALFQTNRFFHRLADPYNSTQPWLLDEFLWEQQWTYRWFQNGYACFTCKKVLYVSEFDFCQTDGDRDKEEGMDEELRFCLPCGVGRGEYPPGKEIDPGPRVHVLCAGCKKFREALGSKYCTECMLCETCDLKRWKYGCEECDGKPHERIVCAGCKKLRGGKYCTKCMLCEDCDLKRRKHTCKECNGKPHDPLHRWSTDDCQGETGHTVVQTRHPLKEYSDLHPRHWEYMGTPSLARLALRMAELKLDAKDAAARISAAYTTTD